MKARPLSFLSMRRSILAGFLILSVAAASFIEKPSAVAQTSSSPSASSTAIRTPDFDESLRWYQDKLQFRLIRSADFTQGRRAILERSGFLLEITEVDHLLQEAQDPSASSEAGVNTPVISFLVPDVDKEIERLRKAGVEILQDPQDELNGRYRTAQIRDNDRHRIELREPTDDYGAFNATGR